MRRAGYGSRVSRTPNPERSALGRYRFVLSPGWIALIVTAVLAAATMVGLGFWQKSRYHQRTEINERITAAGTAPPRPIQDLLAVSDTPRPEDAWTRITATGEYDPAHEILIRGRTLNGRVGFEVVTPLVLPDGSAVLVDRGWVPAAASDATALPEVPPAPSGEVTVVGRVHLPESDGDEPAEQSGRWQARRIDPDRLSAVLPYPVYGGYLLLQEQTPAADPALTPVPVRYEDAAQNQSYMVQWWLFATVALIGTGYLIHREARNRANPRSAARERTGTPDGLREPSASGPRGRSESTSTGEPDQ